MKSNIVIFGNNSYTNEHNETTLTYIQKKINYDKDRF